MKPQTRRGRLRCMRSLVRPAAATAVVAVLAAGCGASGPQARPAPGISGVAMQEPAATARPAAAADLAFGLDLLGAWCKQQPDANIVLSPASLASGLGMAYLGARGSTASAMARVLQLPASGSKLLAMLAARSAALRGLDRPGVTVADADQIWADPKLVTRRAYLNAIATGYHAGLGSVPLLSDPGQAARMIDAAIASATRGHITGLLRPSQLNGIGWVLTDALYLNARWRTPFSPEMTASGQFTTAEGTGVQAKYLTGQLSSASVQGWTAVSVPYRGGQLAMEALMATSGARGCPALSAADLHAVTAALSRPAGGAGSAAVMTRLPEVDLSSKADLVSLLSALGMGQAFSGAANFSRLSPQAAGIGAVEHAATIQAGERGTIASAATAVTIGVSALPGPPKLIFNRPYLLVVTDLTTGEPLFLARVANPDVR
jgi:serine protease inhibitor